MLQSTKRRVLLIVAASAGIIMLAFVATWFIPLEQKLFEPSRVTSLRILDRNNELLREVLSEDNGRGRWCLLSEMSPSIVQAVIATEDTRFYFHPGVDMIAAVRAAFQNIRAGRVVSGASTISMQVVRNIFHSRRTLMEKMREVWYALRLENMMSKDAVLTQYLNRIPFGNQTFGIDAAARLYFSKPASQLSLAESAFLAAIPNSPTVYDPYRRPGHVRERQLYVLRRMKDEGFITEEDHDRAAHEPLVVVPRTRQFKAPHFTTMLLSQLSSQAKATTTDIHTPLDYNIQKSTELLLLGHLAQLKKVRVTNGAIVVIDNRSHSLIAMVGSKDFFDTTSGGQVNGAQALRQPGSALKPFTYGVAFENGATAADLLADIPRENGDQHVDFLPENYDKRYHGPVRLRTALACSYNVPAVRTVERFGEEMLLQRLHSAGFVSLQQPASFYGVGLTLGNGEVSLLELSNAYSALANGGKWNGLRIVDSVKNASVVVAHGLNIDSSSHQVFSEQVAFILTDILSDAQARTPAFGDNSSLNLPFPCAAKTGTSKDYKDNWTVGYTQFYTVGVWVGNFDATPMKLVSGITGAAPLFRDVMLTLHKSAAPPFVVPTGIVTTRVCPRSGMLVEADCPGEIVEYFIQETEPREPCNMHRRFKLDRRNSLLATRATPSEFIEDRVFELFPPMFAQWAEKEGIPKPPTELSAELLKPNELLAINSPATGDVFKIDPILRPKYQAIIVESSVAPQIENVTLWLNGDEVAELLPPYRFHLSLSALRRGNHELILRAKKGTKRISSEPVIVAVQ